MEGSSVDRSRTAFLPRSLQVWPFSPRTGENSSGEEGKAIVKRLSGVVLAAR